MAAALWNGRGDGRRVFNSRRAADGFVFHGTRCGGAVLSLELGEYFSGRRLRGASHYFRRGDCEELWRLNQEHIARSAKNREREERHGRDPRKHPPRISIG